MKIEVTNPILTGFHPDPCICKAENVYYIVVSSFEWLPGVRVYSSHNLINWVHETDILTNQVNLQGNPKNCSIWAPALSYHNGMFYLVYTDVKSTRVPFKDVHNYLITAPSIHGPWSEPIYLNSSGFDPSLFHDTDGRKWFLNEVWDYRMTDTNKSAGIVIQEFSEKENKLIGEVYKIFDGTHLAKTEAPHLYKRNGYYYLITAEGGTGSGHSVTVCRSKKITENYELDPEFPILTASDKPNSPLQCTGHMSITEYENNWYGVYLCTRPLDGKYAILGRETAIIPIKWDSQGWLRLCNEDGMPLIKVEIESLSEKKQSTSSAFVDCFEGVSPLASWNSWRILREDSWCNTTEKRGYLRIHSGESPQSSFRHHLLAIRQQDFYFTAETVVEFYPTQFTQMAGMMLFLNEENYVYCYLTYDEIHGKVLRIMKSVNGEFVLEPVVIPIGEQALGLKFTAHKNTGFFEYKQNDVWQVIHIDVDMINLSGGFTGNFIGLAVHDTSLYKGIHADFSFFRYQPQR